MSDLRTELRHYVEAHVERHTAEDILNATATTEPIPLPARRLRPAVALAVSAFGVLALVGGAVLLLRPTSDNGPPATAPSPMPTETPQVPPPAPEPVPPTAPPPTAPSASYAPPVIAGPQVMAWRRLPALDSVFGGSGWQHMNDIVAGGPGFVAVGRDDSGGDRDAAVWYSTDGLDWRRVPHDESVFGGPGNQQMLAITASDAGFVAVGSEGGDGRAPATDRSRGAPWDFDGAGTSAAVWLSRDGITWVRVAGEPDVFGSDGLEWMTDVTAGSSGFVAVGAHYSLVGSLTQPLHEASLEGDAAVWTSSDALTWRRAADAGGALGGAGWQEIHGITTGGPGFVAVGQEGYEILTPLGPVDPDTGIRWYEPDPEAQTTGAIWTSSDGETWTRVARDRDLFGVHMPVGGELTEGWVGITDVIAGGPGLVAVGRNYPICQPWVCLGTAAIWLSPDGNEWTRVDSERGAIRSVLGFDVAEIVQTGERFVIVGQDSSSGPAMVWYSIDGGQSLVDLSTDYQGPTVPASPLEPVEQSHDCELFGPSLTTKGCGEAPSFMTGVAVTTEGSVVAVGSYAFDASVWIGEWTEDDD